MVKRTRRHLGQAQTARAVTCIASRPGEYRAQRSLALRHADPRLRLNHSKALEALGFRKVGNGPDT